MRLIANPVNQIADAPALTLCAEHNRRRRLTAPAHSAPFRNAYSDKLTGVPSCEDAMPGNFPAARRRVLMLT
jgi:hypothetical protein